MYTLSSFPLYAPPRRHLGLVLTSVFLIQIIGAPSFFPTVWGWIKRWFDPITTSKIFILGHHEAESTLKSFIDAANIPKKYGGELDFKFGDMPVLDPQLETVVTWENGYSNFPEGPLYWVDEGDYVVLKAAGSVEHKDRHETVCKILKTAHDNDPSEKANGGPIAGALLHDPALRPELTQVPTATDDVPQVAKKTALPASAKNGESMPALATESAKAAEPRLETRTEEKVVVQDGKVVPASRPEPTTFHSAQEGLNNLSIAEKVEANGTTTGPHTTATANRLDPAVPAPA